jgi:hypothetical protein
LLGGVRINSTPKAPGRKLANFLLTIAFANLLFFGAECVIEGGSTPFGGARDGHYFLYSRGYRTEVSARTFRINQLHGYSMYLTMPLLVLGLALRRLSEIGG